MKNAIGGYFQLELNQGKEYYSDCVKLNTARNAFEYIIKARKYKKIFLPKYTCDSVLQPLKKYNIEYEFFSIDDHFLPILNSDLIEEDTGVLINNYYGLLDDFFPEITENYKNLIVDNSQAFFSKPINNIDTIYSPRKFFGVPDGAYLFTKKILKKKIPQSISWEYFSYLIKRIDLSAEEGYSDFEKNEKRLDNRSIQKMSKLTIELLKSIDYENVKRIRKQNFLYLHNHLGKFNELASSINKNELNTPLVYPFLIAKSGLRQRLIDNKIYVAQYWKDVFNRTKKGEWENYLAEYLLPLPIDQRYNFVDMKQIYETVIKIIIERGGSN